MWKQLNEKQKFKQKPNGNCIECDSIYGYWDVPIEEVPARAHHNMKNHGKVGDPHECEKGTVAQEKIFLTTWCVHDKTKPDDGRVDSD